MTVNDSILPGLGSQLSRFKACSSEAKNCDASIFTCLTEERPFPRIFGSRLPLKVNVQRVGANSSILAACHELLSIAKFTSVSLDMLRPEDVCISYGRHDND